MVQYQLGSIECFFNLDLPLECKSTERVGVECLRLYCILRNAKLLKKNPEATKIGQTLSGYHHGGG